VEGIGKRGEGMESLMVASSLIKAFRLVAS
jgi:hypothetical protein